MTGKVQTPGYLPEKTYPDDVFLVSYPKSGSTWLRFLIGNYLTSNKCDFTNCHHIIPDIHMNPDQCDEVPRPRFIKSHVPFAPEYRKVVYLVRDGRDVAVSYYFHSVKHGHIKRGTPFKDFLRLFNKGAVGGFGLWSDHVNSWLDNSPGNFLLVRYEDMKSGIFAQLVRVLDFAGLSIDQSAVLAAIEASSLEQMKALEKEQHHRSEGLAGSDPSIPFVRKGRTGEFRHFFTEELIEEFIAAHGSALRRLNYLSESSDVEPALPRAGNYYQLSGVDQEHLSLESQPTLLHRLGAGHWPAWATAQDVGDIEVLLNQALKRLNACNYEPALHLFEEAIHAMPGTPGLNYGKAVSLARLGRTTEAIETLNCLIAIMPEHRKAKLLLEELHSLTNGRSQILSDTTAVRVSQSPKSPLTGSTNLALEKEIDCNFIIEGYKQGFGIDVRKYFEGLDTVQIYKCHDTGFRFYYPFSIQGDEKLYEELQKLPWYYMDWKWEHQIASAPIKPSHKALEIGCGRGSFLETLQQRGISCVGLELNESAIETAQSKGLNVIKQSIEDHAQQHREEYDVVCSFQVLEHIAAVKEFIQASIDALKPGGTMIVSVPNNDSFLFKCDDVQPLNRPPHHVGLWNMTSLINLTKIFRLKLDGIEIEPLQPYHMDWAQSIVREKLIQEYGEGGKMIVKDHELVVSKVAQLILQHVPGHTILAHYTKSEK